jgi:hypothetical protein
MTTELKTVHSFWIPPRILYKLKETSQELEKEKGIKISPNQLAMNLIDGGLKDEKVISSMIHDDDDDDKRCAVGVCFGDQPDPPNRQLLPHQAVVFFITPQQRRRDTLQTEGGYYC